VGVGCPSWLNEPARTYSILHNNALSNAYWVKNQVTITPNSVSSPFQGLLADVIVENANTSQVFGVHTNPRPSGLTLTTRYTVAFMAKKITRDWVYFNDFNAFQSPIVRVWFNLDTGTVGTVGAGVSNASMTAQGDGWWLCEFEFVATGSTSCDYRIAASTSDNTLNYTGTIGQEAIAVIASIFYAGSKGASPIITSASALTRLADAPTLSGASALIGQTEGVIYWEGICEGQTDLLGINRSTTNGLYIIKAAGNLYRGSIYAGGFGIVLVDVGIKNGLTKIALAYKSGDSALFVNGVKIASNTSAFTFSGALSLVELNGNYLIGTQPQLNSNVIFKQTRISDAELIALTTL
jgi:hypothetical protein